MSNLDELTKPLPIEQIDFRIQSINKGGYATILAYKDARVDINRLNQVFGQGRWQKKYEQIGNRLYCSIGIWNDDISEWVWKQDVGTESNTEKEKGQASDASKRACFNLGIGIELYDYPVIQVKLRDEEWELRKGNDGKERPSATWKLKLKDWVWFSQFDEGKISYLAAKEIYNGQAVKRFEWGKYRAVTEIGQISGEPLDMDKIEIFINFFKAQIDEDDPDNAASNIRREWDRLSNDERIKVQEGLMMKAPKTKRMYKTLLADYLGVKE